MFLLYLIDKFAMCKRADKRYQFKNYIDHALEVKLGLKYKELVNK